MAIPSMLQRAAFLWHRTLGQRRLQAMRVEAVREISAFPLHVQRDLLTVGSARIHQY